MKTFNIAIKLNEIKFDKPLLNSEEKIIQDWNIFFESGSLYEVLAQVAGVYEFLPDETLPRSVSGYPDFIERGKTFLILEKKIETVRFIYEDPATAKAEFYDDRCIVISILQDNRIKALLYCIDAITSTNINNFHAFAKFKKISL